MPYKDKELKRENLERNREKRAAYHKEWMKAHPEKREEYQNRYKNKDIERFRAEDARRRKERRKLPWVRTYETVHTRLRQAKKGRKRCAAYVNVKMLMTPSQFKELWERDKAYDMERPSIDRIDPQGDYSYNNCRYLEMEENRKRVKKI